MIYILGKSIVALFDSGATHSFISYPFVATHSLRVRETGNIIHIESSVHRLASINQICDACPIRIGTWILEANLILLLMMEFDVILGMDWLSKWGAIIDCRNRRVQIEGIPREEIQINKIKQPGDVSILIIAMKVAKIIRQ